MHSSGSPDSTVPGATLHCPTWQLSINCTTHNFSSGFLHAFRFTSAHQLATWQLEQAQTSNVRPRQVHGLCGVLQKYTIQQYVTRHTNNIHKTFKGIHTYYYFWKEASCGLLVVHLTSSFSCPSLIRVSFDLHGQRTDFAICFEVQQQLLKGKKGCAVAINMYQSTICCRQIAWINRIDSMIYIQKHLLNLFNMFSLYCFFPSVISSMCPTRTHLLGFVHTAFKRMQKISEYILQMECSDVCHFIGIQWHKQLIESKKRKGIPHSIRTQGSDTVCTQPNLRKQLVYICHRYGTI